MRKIDSLHGSSELFFDVDEIYIQSIFELEEVPKQEAVMTQWFSSVPFGDGVAEITAILDDEESGGGHVLQPLAEDESDGEGEIPFVSFSDYDGNATPLYFNLLREKRRGLGVDLEDMSHGGLLYLYEGESISLERLAALFDTTTEEVEKRLMAK